MDYGRLSRRELQVLCKEHGIPANKTNIFMAEALGSLLNAPKESQQMREESSIPDPADVVKAKAKRALKSKKSTDKLAASEVDDLSSHLANSSVTCDAFASDKVDPADTVVTAVQAGNDDEAMGEVSGEIEPAKVRRKPRSQSSKKGVDSNITSVDAVDEHMKGAPTDVAVPDTVEDPLSHFTYSRRAETPGSSENLNWNFEASSAAIVDCEIPVVDDVPSEIHALAFFDPLAVVEEAPIVVKPLTKKSKSKAKRSTKVKPSSPTHYSEDTPPASEEEISDEVLHGEPALRIPTSGDNEHRPHPSSAPEIINQLPPQEFVAAEVARIEAKPLAKKSKAKGVRTKKVKAASPVAEDGYESVLMDDFSLATNNVSIEDSPAFGLAMKGGSTEEVQFTESRSPSPDDEAFEFQPDPSSFVEIMSQTPPQESVAKGCQHRAGRKSGMACVSCASEKKVADLMHEVLHSIDIPLAQQREEISVLEEVSDDMSKEATEKTEVLVTTPVKLGDDKENSLKTVVDLHSMSMRKLQKEVQKRGLSKRTNTRSTKV